MKSVLILFLLLGTAKFAEGQIFGINLPKYLKPKCDTLYYNCVYDSFHASGLHDTVSLVYREILIDGNPAYYVSSASDSNGTQAQWATFYGSAMIFRGDTLYLASLTEDQEPINLKLENFNHIVPPKLKIKEPFDLAKLKWGYLTEVFIKSAQFENLRIGDRVLNNCLRLNLLVYDRSKEPYNSTVWLHLDYGVVKWIRTTGRTEVLDINLFDKNCR